MEANMGEVIELVYKSYGIIGLVMLSPLAGLVYLWRDYKAISKAHFETIKSLMRNIHDLQEKRVQDAQAIGGKLMELMSEQAAMNKETNMALERIGESAMLEPPR
jgi:hypothetical protein